MQWLASERRKMSSGHFVSSGWSPICPLRFSESRWAIRLRPLRRALRAIGESLYVEPVALWRLSAESDRLELEYSWPPEAAELTPQFLSRTELPWMLDRLLLGNTVSFARHEKLPEEARIDEQTLDRRGVRSLLLVPVMVEGATSGVLSLAAMGLVRSWPEDLLPRMRLLG
jgi:hypothetical protein